MEFQTQLIASMIFGAFGTGYFFYGKKQGKIVPLLTGLALGIFPYFVSNVVGMILVGLALLILPWVLKID